LHTRPQPPPHGLLQLVHLGASHPEVLHFFLDIFPDFIIFVDAGILEANALIVTLQTKPNTVAGHICG
jgi:hypothetical protein